MESKLVDFVFLSPPLFSCMEAEFSVSTLVSLRTLRLGIELEEFGFVFVVRANSTDAHTLMDLKGKKLEAVSSYALGACQMQARTMHEAKEEPSCMMDPAQVHLRLWFVSTVNECFELSFELRFILHIL